MRVGLLLELPHTIEVAAESRSMWQTTGQALILSPSIVSIVSHACTRRHHEHTGMKALLQGPYQHTGSSASIKGISTPMTASLLI